MRSGADVSRCSSRLRGELRQPRGRDRARAPDRRPRTALRWSTSSARATATRVRELLAPGTTGERPVRLGCGTTTAGRWARGHASTTCCDDAVRAGWCSPCATSPSGSGSRSELTHQALHDSLTGLPNRQLFTTGSSTRCPARRRTGAAAGRAVPRPRRLQGRQRQPRATTPATSCSSPSRSGCRRRARPATPPPGSAATSSPCCSTTPTSTAAAVGRSALLGRARRADRAGRARRTWSAPASASPRRSRAATDGEDVCATPTWRCTTPRSAARAPSRCTTPVCTSSALERLALRAASSSGAIGERRARRCTTSRPSTCDPGDHRLRGPGPLAAPRARAAAAAGVHRRWPSRAG